MSETTTPGYLLLEDGSRYGGVLCGAHADGTGEVVFTTGMSGYQESVSDPSFARQIIVFTYPHIGNYGVSTPAMESDRVHARAVVMREAVNREDAPSAERGWLDWLRDCGVPAISGVDTRALVRHIRTKGSMRGGLFAAGVAQETALDAVLAEVPMRGLDLAREVTPAAMTEHGAGNTGPLIAVIDTGIKLSIVRELVDRGARLQLHPCTVSPEELLASDPDAVFLANGPGDPAALDYVVETVRAVVGTRPDLRDLPRSPAALPRRRPGDVQAAVRPPRRQPPCQGPAHREDRDHLAEPRLRGRGAGRRACAWSATSRCAGRPMSARPSSRTSISTTARSRG